MGKDEPCAEGSLLILLLAIASCPLPTLAEKKAQEKGHRTMFSSLGPNIGSSTLLKHGCRSNFLKDVFSES